MRVVSLFSGCGGLDLGFSNCGYEILAALDQDVRAVETYNRNFNRSATVATLTAHFSDLPAESIDCVIAGPPCQGFSTATGYPKIDERNAHLMTACQIAVSLKPKLILIENVAGLYNSRNFQFLHDAISFLSDKNYHVEIKLLECERFGIAQRRRRLFIVARSDKRTFELNLDEFQTAPIIVSEALRGLHSETDGHVPVYPEEGSAHAKIISRIRPGQKLCNVRASLASIATWDIPEVFGNTSKEERAVLKTIQKLRRVNRRRSFGDADPVPIKDISSVLGIEAGNIVESLILRGHLRHVGGNIDLRHTYNGKYRRLSPGGISPTVDTQFGSFRKFVHPVENRGMTAREAARLQGFPDSFLLPTKAKDAFKQIGNAVPPPVAFALARFLRKLQ